MQANLPELVGLLQEIEKQEVQAQESGDILSEEIFYQKEVLSRLVAGRVDQAVEMKNALENHIDALKAALDRSQETLVKIEDAFKKTLEITNQPRIDGLAWSVRLQNNSRASTIIENETKIPEQFWQYAVSISKKFPAEDKVSLKFWMSVVLGRPVTEDLSKEDQETVNKSIQKTLNKTEIESALKKDADAVPGARLQKGKHVRFCKGEARPKMLEDSK